LASAATSEPLIAVIKARNHRSLFYKIAPNRVARWIILRPKIPILAYFWNPYNGKFGYILWPFRYFWVNLLYFTSMWYILW
jgi:hypothetical protein